MNSLFIFFISVLTQALNIIISVNQFLIFVIMKFRTVESCVCDILAIKTEKISLTWIRLIIIRLILNLIIFAIDIFITIFSFFFFVLFLVLDHICHAHNWKMKSCDHKQFDIFQFHMSSDSTDCYKKCDFKNQSDWQWSSSKNVRFEFF